MKDIKTYIGSGILEMYVLDLASDEERKEVETLAAIHPEIREEIEAISGALTLYNTYKAPAIDPGIKAFLMATIDYTERLKGGETPAHVPELNDHSKISDYAEWLQRPDMVLDSEDDAYAKIIGYSNVISAIAWLKNEMPYEVHQQEIEKFLVVEGSCDVIFSGKVISLRVGDYIAIPVGVGHTIKITSEVPCKVILQRVAA